MYKKRTNIPPIIIKKIIYEYQKLIIIIPDKIEIQIVCNKSINPMDKGWFKNINIKEIKKINNIIIQRIV